MKIAFVLASTDHLGPFIIAKDIIANLPSDANNTIEVFYLKTPKNPINFGVKTTQVESFFKSINFSDFDVIHSHGFTADLYVSAHLKQKTKWVATLHQKIKPNYLLDYNKPVATVLEFVWLSALKKANCVISLTKEMEAYYKPKLKTGQVKYIYNGIPTEVSGAPIPADEWQQIKQLKAGKKLMGISARLVYLKGIDQVIQVLALRNDYSLLLIGVGPEKDNLIKLAQNLGVEERIVFLGYKPNPCDYLSLCDMYIMSSRTEGFGLCVLEAASVKLPVVCSDIPVYQELFTDEVVRFELEDIESLAKALDTVTANSIILSEKIYKTFLNKFTAKIMAEAYYKLYQGLL
jgi:glycosyltransferase involved in cell wall biosynthesis